MQLNNRDQTFCALWLMHRQMYAQGIRIHTAASAAAPARSLQRLDTVFFIAASEAFAIAFKKPSIFFP
jgi:hypothetical protein